MHFRVHQAIEPISPDDVVRYKEKQIPDFVIKAFNDLIAKNFLEDSSTVYQKDVEEEILSKNAPEDDNIKWDSSVIFANNWLDVEDIYRAKGWKVHYDKPGWNESYNAYFVFKRK